MNHDSKLNPPSGTPSPLARKLRLAFFSGLALLAVINVFIGSPHPHFGLEAIPEFWALFGLAGAVILAKGAKGLAHTILGKDENFYEKKE
jgi:uncharacterized membrane protein YdcZ (DUF606 family)